MQLKFIHHVAIICSDYERSKTFYTDILGGVILRETYRAERDSYKLDIALAGSQLELFSFANPPKRPSYPEACGLRHLAFGVDDLEATHSDLEQKNVLLQDIRLDTLTSKRFFFFEDPDGLPLEVYEL